MKKIPFPSLCAPLINSFECSSQSENNIYNKMNENKENTQNNNISIKELSFNSKMSIFYLGHRNRSYANTETH